MNILITGANGFVGHTLVEKISSETDWNIHCLVNKNEDRLNELNVKTKIIYILQDDLNIDIVFHTAGNPSSLSCIDNPKDAIDKNILETFKILEFVKNKNIKHFIYFSTIEIFNVENMYAATKLSCEHLCNAYMKSYNVPCSIVRLTNTFGKRCQPARFPVLAIKKILNNEPFVIHIDGEKIGTRQWISINDTIDMVLYIVNLKPGQSYNLTGRECINNLEFVSIISKILNKEFTYELKPENISGRILCQTIEPSFNWIYKNSIEEELKNFVDWTLNHHSKWLGT